MTRLLKRLATGLALFLLILIAILAFNTIRYVPEQTTDVELSTYDIEIEAAAGNLSRAIQLETDSTKPRHPDFGRFQDFLEQTFPAVHGGMERVMIKGNTPLYRWSGTDGDLQPVLLAAHYDVVPVPPDGIDRWDHPPFAGDIADGFVWGRGALDNKGALISIMTAAEMLIKDGFAPRRTIYLSFAHDEEVTHGAAKAVAEHLQQHGIQLAWVLDEGSFVFEDVIPGLEVPAASINVAEKGSVTLQLVAKAAGGHSSMPPRKTAVGNLAEAVVRLQENPVPGGLSGLSGKFFDGLGRHFALSRRIIFANRWLFDPLLERILSQSPSTNAMLRTTTAPTMLSGSNKVNVLATEAVATVNFRIHPRDTVDGIVAHIREVIDDEEIEIRVMNDVVNPPSSVSGTETRGYRDIEESLFATFGPVASVPGLTIARTDAAYYAAAADNAYRINPFLVTGDDLPRLHGTNERLSVENLERGITFFLTLMRKQ